MRNIAAADRHRKMLCTSKMRWRPSLRLMKGAAVAPRKVPGKVMSTRVTGTLPSSSTFTRNGKTAHQPPVNI